MLFAILLAVSSACGIERQPVKILADHPIISVSQKSSIGLLRRLVPPRQLGKRRNNMERMVVTVKGLVTLYKLEADRDIHIVLDDGSGKTMVVESVAPSCARTTSNQSLFAYVRNELRLILPYDSAPKPWKLATPICVQVTGFLFFDKIHGQLGVAPNGIEIHPITDIVKC